ASVAFLQQKYFGEAAWKKECERQHNIGFVFTEGISQIIKKYDENRSSYPDFSDILPEIAAYFAHRADPQLNGHK
ncbi:MAG: DUF4932 domain-containing protein, partial [Chitinophagaceae bacterium]|nr:DUF4932 domain-containing protein [Chitinophagaceae bacterium]